MKTILVPVDFSKTAINSFRVDLDIASQSEGTVDLLHLIELPVVNDTVTMPVITFERSFFKDLREKMNKEFDNFLSKYDLDGKVCNLIDFTQAFSQR